MARNEFREAAVGRVGIALLALLWSCGKVNREEHQPSAQTVASEDGRNVADTSRAAMRAPQAPCGVAAWLLEVGTVGPIRLDGTFEDVRRICDGARDTADPATGEYSLVVPGFEPPIRIDASGAESPASGPLGIVVIRTPEIATREGVRVGSSVGDIRRLLGAFLLYDTGDWGIQLVSPSRPGIAFVIRGLSRNDVPGGWRGDSALTPMAIPDSLRVVEIHASSAQ